MKIYIYAIYFPTSHKRYIGWTNNLKRRMSRHLRDNKLVGRALQKYNDWQISILHTVKSCDEANRIEIEEIRNFSTLHPNGYNLTRGGEGSLGFCHTDESKAKMRNAKTDFSVETLIRMSAASKGRIPSAATRVKMKRARIGKKHSVEIRAKIGQTSKGRTPSIETRMKMSGAHKEENIPIDVKIKRLKNKIAKLEGTF